MGKAPGLLQLGTLQPKMERETCREPVCISIHGRVRTSLQYGLGQEMLVCRAVPGSVSTATVQ